MCAEGLSVAAQEVRIAQTASGSSSPLLVGRVRAAGSSHDGGMINPTTSRLLLTGAAGNIGSWMRAHLARPGEVLRAFDLAPLSGSGQQPPPAEELVQGDIRSFDDVQRAVAGCGAVVHLAAIPVEGTFDDVLESNFRGTYNVFEACRREGCRRVVFASSNHAIGFYPIEQLVSPELPPRPDTFYGLSKAYGELLARLYFDRFGIESASLRIGTFKDRPENSRELRTMVSKRDLTQLIRCCLDTPDLGYAVFHGVSANRERWWTDDARERVGYEPEDDAWAEAPELVQQPVGYRCSGGAFTEAELGVAM